MKNRTFLLFIITFTFFAFTSLAQSTDDAIIRKLENEEREAILKSDTVALSRLMSPKIVVQNPENAIVGYRQIIDRIKAGKISYSTFERNIENISFIEIISVVMGTETLIPQGTSQNAGKTVKRKFTNIWMKENDSWRLVARQATIMSVN